MFRVRVRVRVSGGPPVGTDSIIAGRWCGSIIWLVGVCGSWAGPRNPQGKKKPKTNIRKKNRVDAYAFTFRYGKTHGPARGPGREIHGPTHGNGGPPCIEPVSHGPRRQCNRPGRAGIT